MASELMGTCNGHASTTPPLTVTTRHPRAGTAVCTVAGEVDTFTAPLLRDELREATGNGRSHLVIDLTGVTFFGAAGIRLLIQARDAQHDGYQLVLVASRPVVRVLDICALDQPLPRYPDVDSAVAACSNPAG